MTTAAASPRQALREKALRTLEFERVREMLAALTSFPLSRELALGLTPAYRRYEAGQLQALTRDAMRLLRERPGLAIDGAKDVRQQAQAAALGGGLTGPELMETASTLAAVHFTRGVLLRSREGLPALGALGESLAELRELESTIRKALSAQGEVLDSASDLLHRLRRESQTAQQRLMARLEEFMGSPLGRQALQEPFITTRDGRYVLPVKAEMRSQVQGLIHDISSSGATVFMEPLTTVELGNAWRELQLAERREVERILRELSARVGEQGEAIQRSLEALGQIDLALAKAHLAQKMRGVLPRLAEPGEEGRPTASVHLLDARHPLLTGEVAPVSVTIGKEFRALVISGPNTGGKTVALKTVGLLALMAQAGLAIPASEGSALAVFDGVYADIGDEQSIQQSLSTFSSHMSTIVGVLRAATGRSLVLLDELGAGTDPLEGSAIARAILDALVRMGATTVVTTHHSELKAFARSREGMENASVEFDPVTLAPTYRLTVGLPGRSNAIAIAERLGLPEPIVQAARAELGPREAEADRLLREIQEERRKAGAERAEAEAERREAEAAKARLAETTREAEEQQRRTAMVRKAELQVMAEEVKAQLRHIARRANALLSEEGRKEVADLRGELETARQKMLAPQWQEALKGLHDQDPLAPGERVRVEGLESSAEVVAGPDARQMVDLQVGQVRVRVHRDRIKGKDASPQPLSRRVLLSPGAAARATVGTELWVHGMRAQQAVEAVDEYLEKAAMAGHQRVRIVHGKGRGLLRKAIHRALEHHPLRAKYRYADPEDGGEGVTIVEF